MGTHLFSLNEYNQAHERFISVALWALITSKDPLLARIGWKESQQLPIVQNTMPSGEVVEGTPFRTEGKVSVPVDDLVTGNLDAFVTALDDAAESFLKEMMPQLFERLGKISQSAGTAVDAGGQPVSHELMLRAFENLQIDFDDQGNPLLPTIFVGPDLYDQMRTLPSETEAQKKAWDEMIERKRREFNDRRRYRKLS
jgi:hypothetical protein